MSGALLYCRFLSVYVIAIAHWFVLEYNSGPYGPHFGIEDTSYVSYLYNVYKRQHSHVYREMHSLMHI